MKTQATSSFALLLLFASAEGELFSEIECISYDFWIAKVFSRCELARDLVNKEGFARATVGNWVCLANVKQNHWSTPMFVDTPQYESGYNTAATNDNTNGSRDYGIFQVNKLIISSVGDGHVQINDDFWCDANVGYGADCGVSCSRYRHWGSHVE